MTKYIGRLDVRKKYTILNAKSSFSKVNDLIACCKFSINASLDSWGVRLLLQCKDSIIKAMTNNVKFRLLVGYESLDEESLLQLPEDINLRIGNIRSSKIIIDSVNMVLIDSKNGKGCIFQFFRRHRRLLHKTFRRRLE